MDSGVISVKSLKIEVGAAKSAGVLHCHLDSPKDGQFFSDSFVISGWLLKKAEKNPISLWVEIDSELINVPLAIKRQDVVSKVLRISDSDLEHHPQLNCGFRYEIKITGHKKAHLYLCDGEQKTPWLTFSAAEVDAEEKNADLKFIWPSLFGIDNNSDHAYGCVKAINNFGPGVLAQALIARVKVLGLNNLHHVADRSQAHNVRRFFDCITGTDFPLLAVQQAVEKNKITLPDPFTGGHVSCNKSLSLKNNINVLFFRSESGSVLFIFQHVSSVDAVFFPGENKLVLLKHLGLDSVVGAITHILDDFQCVMDYMRKEDSSFIGVICSSGRPYHFYYDVAPAINDLYSSGLLGRVPRLFYYKGGNFCSFKNVYGLKCKESSLTPTELAKLSGRASGFCFHVGTAFDTNRTSNAVEFDKQLVRYARESYGYILDLNHKELLKRYPVIWVGVTVQKRSWLEQVDAIAKVMNELSKDYPRLAVVFDGWTSPLNTTEVDVREIRNDLAVCSKIEEKLNASIKVFNLVGANSCKKIIYARSVDVYTGNSSTGGLHIDRMCGRPGIAHLNTKLIDSDEHIRNRTILVDKSLIKDRPEDVDMRMDFISYSLDWRVVYEGLRGILNGESV
jgi:hypothetical protein